MSQVYLQRLRKQKYFFHDKKQKFFHKNFLNIKKLKRLKT